MNNRNLLLAGLALLLIIGTCLFFAGGQDEALLLDLGTVVVDVDPSRFLATSLSEPVTKVPCTLSDGSTGSCYLIVSASNPTDHQMGPWCPENITDGAEAGGVWVEGGEIYDVDGAFIKNMANFYGDNTWQMYDAKGDIYVTATKEDCANAANPKVGEEYRNYCVECLPSFLVNATQTYLIPVSPVQITRPNNRIRGMRGVAFNGIRFDAPAPTHAILGACTLAPFDDAGGHINLHAGYHYHTATGKSKEIAQADGHAPMIGYAMDGHGLYAHLDANGKAPTDLDDCRGHYDEIRGYHYHVDAPGTNNFINCLAGATAR